MRSRLVRGGACRFCDLFGFDEHALDLGSLFGAARPAHDVHVVRPHGAAVRSPSEPAAREQHIASRIILILDSVDKMVPGRPEGRREVGNSADSGGAQHFGKWQQELMVNRTYHELVSWQFCNYRPQNRRISFQPAHLLLPVRNCSALIKPRRRGASQGRPVLGGSLKSSHARGAVDFVVVFGGSFIRFVQQFVRGSNLEV